MEKIEQLLQSISDIKKQFESEALKKGEAFNIFSIMSMEYDEVYTHSAIIGELLNPKGTHGQGNAFLNLFVKKLNDTFQFQEPLLPFGSLVAEKICERTISQTNDWDSVTGGRIDIILEDSNQLLIIENKPGYEDQPYQLIRYKNYANTRGSKKHYLFYLTLDGRDLKAEEDPYIWNGIEITGRNFKANEFEAYEKSETASKTNCYSHQCLYYPISFEKHIKEWIEECIKGVTEHSNLIATLQQYLTLINKITNQSTNHKMSAEIKKYLLDKSNDSKLTVEEKLSASMEVFHVVKEAYCEEYFNRIGKKLDVKMTTYNSIVLGKANSGKWISEKEKLLLWFRNDYSGLELGYTDEHNKWDGSIKIDEHFNTIEWEVILTEENIDGVAEKIEDFMKKVSNNTVTD